MHSFSDVMTEAGKLRVGFNSDAVTMLCLAEDAKSTFEDAYQRRFGVRPRQGKIPKSYSQAVIKAAAGREFNPVPLDLSHLPVFQRRVLEILQQVSRGNVRTYAWLARKAGRPRAARAVGNAMAHNPIPILIPCHRVVPATGGVGNYGLGSAVKRALLEREGVAVDHL